MRALSLTIIIASSLLPAALRAQTGEPPERPELPGGWLTGGDEDDDSPEPDEPKPVNDASTPEFQRAMELQRQKKWKAAQKVFRDLLEKYPDSPHKATAEHRSDDNAFLGCEIIHKSGPPERRIDVTVMGDGFTIDEPDQVLQQEWAKLCLDVLWSEYSFQEYKDYFNFYFVRLASLEEGVDPALSEEQKQKIIERNKSRTRKRKTEFSTALDCKEAGSQGQVLADRNLVHKFLKIASKETPGCRDDKQVIAFARFGKLGMGGGGIANVGRPDKSVTVHEFGHSFVGLLDEYAVNPMSPREPIFAPNAATTSDPEKVPWAHFIKKRIGGIGVFKGGATYIEGVWRPARSCAMNSAGHTNYCFVCREAAILRIYSYVNPIDHFSPTTAEEVIVTANTDKYVSVTPMKPRSKSLDVDWFVEPLAGDAPMPETQPEPRTTGTTGGNRFREMFLGPTGGTRGKDETRAAAMAQPPVGAQNPLGTTRKGKDGAVECIFPVGRLKPGVYRVTAHVADRNPFVLLDPKHLLEERKTWTVKVTPPSTTGR
jgi:IgA Peptidase M64